MEKKTSQLSNFSEELAALVAQAEAGVVSVEARRRMPASGIMISDTHVLTASHVVEMDEGIQLAYNGKHIPATVLGRDAGLDLCVLKVEGAGIRALKPASHLPEIGSLGLALGKATGAVEVSLGVVRAIYTQVTTASGGYFEHLIQTEANPYPGFSGGPFLNMDGEIYGLNTSGLAMGTLLTIPIGQALEIAETLIQHGKVRRGYLGVRTQPVRSDEAQRTAGVGTTGLLVVGVEEDSPAQRGGLLVGDMIISISSTAVIDHESLQSILLQIEIGKPIPVQVIRAGARVTLMITLGER